MERFFRLGARLRDSYQQDPWLWWIICGAFLLRIVGICYGLPLTVVADEPPFVLGALQMLQLHTLIPAFHLAVFKKILYYPPYLSYLYLIPFTIIIGGAALLWHVPTALLEARLLADLSPFFLVARVGSVLLGTLSVYFVYRIAQSLFTSRTAAAASAFLLATSVLHESLSMVGRHWMPVSFFFLLVFYLMTREWLPRNRRILYSCTAVGAGVGISTIVIFATLPILFWFVFESDWRLRDLVRDRLVWAGAITLAVLAPLPTLLYPNSNNYLFGALFLSGKTMVAVLLSPLAALATQASIEPVLIGLFGIGLALLWRDQRRHAFFLGGFFLTYVVLFYFLTHIQPRFVLPLVPIYALAGGYAVSVFARQKLGLWVAILLLCLPLAISLRVATLAVENDTRAQARTWLLHTLTPTDKVIVYARLTRLPTTPSAVAELRALDPGAVRQVDSADSTLGRTSPYALNLHAFSNDAFFATLPAYAATHHYTYLLYEPGIEMTPAQRAGFATLIKTATPVATWQGFGSAFSIADSNFRVPLSDLLSHAALGPTVVVYHLAQ